MPPRPFRRRGARPAAGAILALLLAAVLAAATAPATGTTAGGSASLAAGSPAPGAAPSTSGAGASSRAAGSATSAPVSALRRTAPAFGGMAAVEVRDLPPVAAAAAVAAALEEIREIERLATLEPAGEDGLSTRTGARESGGLGTLVAGEPVAVDPRLARLLDRARSFCLWSKNAHGPLGGRLYRLWRVGPSPAGDDARPTPAALAAAVESARCDGLTIDLASSTVTLPAGAVPDLTGFTAGFAADRAADALRAAGAANGVVEAGGVIRAFGPGPEGAGWPVELPAFPGTDGPLGRLLLRDRSIAVAAADARPILIAGDRHGGLLDQRTGRPATGVVAVAAATELAVDAQALATAALVLGSRETTFLLGQLRPTPSILWLLGTGSGRPLLTSHHWSKLPTF